MCVHVVVHLSLRINKNDNQKPAGKNKNKKNSCNFDMILTIKYFYFLFLLRSTIDFHELYAKKYFLTLNQAKNIKIKIKLSIRDSAKCTICKNKFSKINSRV